MADEKYAGGVYNIAYGGQEKLMDVYHQLTKALGLSVEPIFGPEREGDIKHSNADITKAKIELGFNPEWSFDRGINEAIEWYARELTSEHSGGRLV